MEGENTERKILKEDAGVSTNCELLTPEPEKATTCPNSSIQNNLDELMDEVFNNDLLREMILGQVIQNEFNEFEARDDLRAVRLVAKSWLQYASKYLLETGQPLFRLKLAGENSLSSSNEVQQNGGKLLDRFASLMESPVRLDTQTPPIALRIRPDFFREENRQSFSDFLTQYAPGLVGLHIAFPRNGGSMNLLFNGVNLSFPRLRKFKVAFPPQQPQLGEEEARSCAGSNLIALPFIQAILNGSEKIREFRFPYIGCIRNYIPHDIRYLSLPPTITTLDVGSFVRNSEFEPLLSFHLPSVHTLTFCIHDEPYTQGLLTQILEKFAASLRHLRVCDTGNDTPEYPSTKFRFPLMEKLEMCLFCTRYAEIEEGHPPLHNLLPNLECLELVNQTKEIMQKWTEFSIFENVRTLRLEIIDGSPCLNTHFPNLQRLELNFRRAVDFAFMNHTISRMPQLVDLYISLYRCEKTGNVNDWDSFFSGIPVGLVVALRENPELWSAINWEKLPQPPIRKIRGLKRLRLICKAGAVETGPLISDFAFHYGFMEVPTLTDLYFQESFKASPTMARIWRERGCTYIESSYHKDFDPMDDREDNTEEDIDDN